MIRKLATLTTTLWFMGNLCAQTYELPIFYGQVFNDPQINAIQLTDGQAATFTLGHRRNGGNFAGVHTSMFSGRYRIGSEENSTNHVVGLQIISDKEGFLLSRNRVAATYANHLNINQSYKLAAGVNAGFYNFAIKATENTGGFSSYAFDGSINLKLYNSRTQLGLSLNQFTNAQIAPVFTEMILQRHINLYAQHKFEVNEAVVVTPTLYTRYSAKNISVYSGLALAGAVQVLVKNRVMAGVSTETRNGSFIYLGLEHIEIGESNLGIDFSYFLPYAGNQRMNVQLFEVFLTYDIGLKK